jgi:hypothetical protein
LAEPLKGIALLSPRLRGPSGVDVRGAPDGRGRSSGYGNGAVGGLKGGAPRPEAGEGVSLPGAGEVEADGPLWMRRGPTMGTSC